MPIEIPDQPVHQHNLINVFSICLKKSSMLGSLARTSAAINNLIENIIHTTQVTESLTVHNLAGDKKKPQKTRTNETCHVLQPWL